MTKVDKKKININKCSIWHHKKTKIILYIFGMSSTCIKAPNIWIESEMAYLLRTPSCMPSSKLGQA